MCGKTLFRAGDFVYKVLDPGMKDAAVAVLARAFCTEPVCAAVGEVDPKFATPYHEWIEFVDYWGDHCSTNGMSVYALDEKNHRIAGVFIVRDLLYFPPGFEDKYRAHDRSLCPWMQFLWHLDDTASKKLPLLATGAPGNFVDLWFLGVHPDYRGHKIANHLMKACLPLCKSAGFEFATVEATSYFTSQAARWNDFEEVCSIEARNFEYQGKPLYTNAPAPHGTWTFWLKVLESLPDAAGCGEDGGERGPEQPAQGSGEPAQQREGAAAGRENR